MDNASIAIYTRTASSPEEDNGEIYKQIDICAEYFLSGRKPEPISFNVYMDSSVSGFATDALSLKQLQQDIEAGQIKTVIVKDLQRLSRSLELQKELEDFFKKYNVTLITVK